MLTNKHLMAEYRELPRIFSAVQKLIERGGYEIYLKNIKRPEKYVLGPGHVKFFYDKIPWLIKRYKNLYLELKENRLYKLSYYDYNAILCAATKIKYDFKHCMQIHWQPSPQEVYLNMARLCQRSKLANVLIELAS